MGDELEIYEADRYKRKDDELDFSKEEKGGGCSPLIVGVFILSLFTPNVIIKNDK